VNSAQRSFICSSVIAPTFIWPELFAWRRGLCHGHRNRDRVGFGPDRCPAGQIDAMHRDFELAAVDIYLQVVVVNFLTLKRIVSRAFDWIRVGSRASRYEICDAAVFVALIVVHVSRENDDPRAQVLLARFQHLGQFVLRRPGRVSSTELLSSDELV